MEIPKPDPIKEAITGARKTQILDAASQVFAEKGFHRATIKDVAQTAGVADGTIYNYFANKNDLLVALLERLADVNQFTGQTAQFSEQATPAQILGFILHNRFDLLINNQAQLQALIPQAISDTELGQLFYDKLAHPALDLMEQAWQRQAAEGHIRAVDLAVVVRAFFAMTIGIGVLAMIGDPILSRSKESLVEVVLDLLLNGLLPRNEDEATD